LADTLGSAGVIVSACLMWAFGWMIADPICSIFIALLIVISVWGLISDAVKILMQRQPEQLDHELPEACNKVRRVYAIKHHVNVLVLVQNKK
jgi:zinc transporter 5/7